MTSRRHSTAWVSTTAMVMALAVATAAAAKAEEAPPAAEPAVDGDIIVTARMRDERQIDVPVALSVVSGARFTDGEHLRIEDLNMLVPGINISIPTPRQTTFSIRGLGANPANDGLEQSTGLFLDGVYLAKSGMAVVDLIDIDRIEVLRGPQGTLIGKNTTAGAIRIQTKGPSFEPEAVVRASTGNFGSLQVQGSVTGPLSDTVAARLTLYRTTRDGWVYNPFRDEKTNAQERQGVRAQLLFRPTSDLSIRLTGEVHHEGDSNYTLIIPNQGVTPATFYAGLNAAGGQVAFSPDGRLSNYDSPTVIRSTQHALTALVDWDFGDVALASITGYREWNYYTISDIDGSSAPLFRASSDLSYRQFSQELRLSSSSDSRLKWTIGGYLFDQHTDYTTRLYYDTAAASQLTRLTPAALAAAAAGSASLARLLAYNGSRWDTHADPRTRSYALFGQATFAVTPRFNVTAGARATYETKRMTVSRDAPVSQTTGAAVPALLASAYAPVGVSRNDWSPSLLLSVDYKPRPGLMIYASASHGEKAGGLNAALPATGLGPDSLKVEPEAATSLEAGIKGELLDRKITFSANGFYTWVKDYQASFNGIPSGGTAPVQLLSNVGKVETRGFELEVAARPARYLDLRVNGAFIDAFYRSYRNAPCPAGTTATSCDLSGQQIVGSPKWSASASATYDRPVTASANAYLGGEFSWRSDYPGFLDNSPQARVGNYALVNLRAGFKSADGRWDVGLWVKNLFDKSYALNYTSYGALVPGIYLPYFGDPRTYGLATTVKF
ncbi:TonB-dependent receptor [soil metagenome]